jgi:glycosyltransferase involved in cell wall biosynthesis
MRILVATDQWSPDVVGGSARVAADTAGALARRGHEVVVLAPSHRGLPSVEQVGLVEVRRVLRRGHVPQTFADPIETRRAARALPDRSFDVLLAHQATGAAGLLAARVNAPLALVFHASAVLELRFLRERVQGARRALLYGLDPVVAVLERLAVRRADTILTLSQFSADLLRSRHPSAAARLRVVGGGVDDAFFDPPPEDPDSCRTRLGIPPGILLFTARRLEPRMGVDVFLQALALIGDDRVVLAVAGAGSARATLDDQVRRLGLQDHVRLLGRVSDDDLRTLYAAADLFVLPTVAYEGFGMSTVEALAAGTPVLGTAVGATPEVLAGLDADFVVSRAAPEALAEGIRRVLPRLGPALRARARGVAEERYRWDTAIVAWEEALLDAAR